MEVVTNQLTYAPTEEIARNIHQELFDWEDPDPIFYQVNPIDPIFLPGAITTPKEVHILLPLHML